MPILDLPDVGSINHIHDGKPHSHNVSDFQEDESGDGPPDYYFDTLAIAQIFIDQGLITNDDINLKIEQFDNVVQIDPQSLEISFENINEIDIIYPGVGENYDFIIEFKNLHNKNIFNLVREEDLFAWKFAKKGFFKFKENIPKINQRIFQNY